MSLLETFQKLNKIYEAKERLDEGKKINIPDYNQEHDIDSYVIEVTTHPTLGWIDGEYYVGKEGAVDNVNSLTDCVTKNLEEAERYDSIESAWIAIEDILDNTEYGWGKYLHKQKNERHYRVAFDTDNYNYNMNDEDWNWTDFRIKPLYIRKTMYLELGD